MELTSRTEFAYPITLNLTGFPDIPFAMTLCYTSLDVADRWINAYSDLNRTEPTAAWEAGGNISLTAVASQLDTGYTSASSWPSIEERSVMGIRPLTN